MLQKYLIFDGAMHVDHMTDKEFERVCSHLAQEYGLNMESKRVLLECRLTHEREQLGLSSFTAYLNLVKSNRNPIARDRFIDLVTTHYTYFLRESNQFEFLTSTAFPELLKRQPEHPWNILCAGCSTGEECYTVSMLVDEYARGHRIPPVRITGIDISAIALEKARKAAYPATHVDKIPQRWLRAYFTENNGEYTVSNKLRTHVTFKQGNLCDDGVLNQTYDLILCRNVIIYFHDKIREQVLGRLHKHLAPAGYLVLGHAEIVRDHTLFAYQGNSIYQKQMKAIPL